MSQKAARKKAEVKEEGASIEKTVHEAPKLAPTPLATVLSRHEGVMQPRSAKGFSMGELNAAGIAFDVARGLKLSLDIRRRSSLDDNVGRLKAWYQPTPKKTEEPKTERKTKVKRKGIGIR